jgi:hypothetical protein
MTTHPSRAVRIAPIRDRRASLDHWANHSRKEAILVRLCSMVLRKRLRRSGTISLTSPLARVSIDSRRRVAAPPWSGASSTRWRNRKVRTAHPRPRTGLADTPSQLRFLPPGGCLAGAQYWPFVPRQLFPARSGSSPARPGPTWDGSQSDGRRRSRTPSPADCASVSRRSQQTRQPTLLHSVIRPFRTRTARSRLPGAATGLPRTARTYDQ